MWRYKKVHSYIICHDQKIADKSTLNRFLPNPQWVMVGNNKFTSGIIARKLKKNIENHPYLVAYTAFFSLVHNGFIEDNEYYAVVEYDIKVSQNFKENVSIYLYPNSIIGFIPYDIRHPLFMGPGTELLQSAIKEVYGLDVKNIIYNEIARNRTLWCATSNCVISGKDLKDFVNWFDPLIPHFHKNPMAAHFPERSLRIFQALNNIDSICLKNILQHEQRKSHGIEYFLH